MNFAKEIKQMIDTRDVFEKYGFVPNYAGFVCCPLHGEKTPSLKVYSGNRGWHCFGCGESGDIIDFVMAIFGISFADAMKKLNEDFCLGLPIGRQLDRREKEEFAKRQAEMRAEQKRKEDERNAVKKAYYIALDDYIRLDRQKREFAPKKGEIDLHPAFVESIMGLVHAEERLNQAELEMHKYEARYN